KAAVRPPKGADILLVQSGALLPDHSLLKAMSQNYDVQAFSGVPLKSNGAKKSAASQAKAMRLAAANAGADYVVCVWGTLETAEGELPGEAVSWIPVGGQFVPDKQKATRINLTAIVVNVSNGQWTSVSSTPVIRDHVSAPLNRTAAWAKQVEALKAQAYPKLADAITRA
ncbi:MAG: aminopeptidase, partial [Verrucomicrobiota bacterium]